MEHLKLAIATIETQLDELRNEVKQLEEQPKPQVETAWYDFTDEQQRQLGRIVKNFISNLVNDLGSTDVHLRENGIEVSVEVDLTSLVDDEIPYNIDNDFIEYLNDEITEQREEQQQDCEESN